LAQARSALYGPVTAANPDEHRETARLIQRGQAVPDARFAAKALAYAHFRMLTNLLAALVWLVFAGLLVWWATRGSSVATGKVLAAAGWVPVGERQLLLASGSIPARCEGNGDGASGRLARAENARLH